MIALLAADIRCGLEFWYLCGCRQETGMALLMGGRGLLMAFLMGGRGLLMAFLMGGKGLLESTEYRMCICKYLCF
jgi:hypothetical protein